MATGRSFAEFVKDKCYNGLYQTAEEYVNENWESMNLYTRNVHRVGYAEMIDATIERVYVRDLPGMRVAFEIGMQLEIDVKEGDYYYDESDQCYPWIRVYCEAISPADWMIGKSSVSNRTVKRVRLPIPCLMLLSRLSPMISLIRSLQNF